MKTIIEIANEQGWDDSKLLQVVTDWIGRDAYREQSVTYHAQYVADAENPPREFEVEVVFTVVAKNEDDAVSRATNILAVLTEGRPDRDWSWEILEGAATAIEDHYQSLDGVPDFTEAESSAHSEQDTTTGRHHE